LYLKVKLSLRARILGGEYKPGQKIPSEANLVREFGVSAITIRRALRELRVEGRLVGRQGVGVFVVNQPRISRFFLKPSHPISLGDEIQRAGFKPGIVELGFALGPTDASVMNELNLSSRSLVYRHEKLILADANPVCFDLIYMPRALGELIGRDLSAEFVLPVLKKYDVRYRTLDYSIEVSAATEREAAALLIEVGAPLLSVRYFAVAPNGRRLFAGHMLARAEWFRFQFRVPLGVSRIGS
jgi:DNA-binding GntR family transcriptional regulator